MVPVAAAEGLIVDLLKVFLKMNCETAGEAQKRVASAADLEGIAADDSAVMPVLGGWRRALFGNDVLARGQGHLALAVSEDGCRVEALSVDSENQLDDEPSAGGAASP